MRQKLLFILMFSIIKLSAQQINDTSCNRQLTGYAEKSYKRQKSNLMFFRRVLTFSDPSWVSPPGCDQGSEKGSYILSADMQPIFAIGGERLPFAIHIVPRFIVRIFRNNPRFNDRSEPVRTPSFMPGGSFLIPLKKASNPYQNIHYLSVRYSHHSNGQDAPHFLSNGSLNTYNGDFSTEIFELGYNFNFRHQRTNVTNKDMCICDSCNLVKMPYPYKDWYGRIAIEQHAWTSFDFRGIYGRTRLNIKSGYIWVANKRWRVRNSPEEEWQSIGNCYKRETFRLIGSLSVNLDKLRYPYSGLSRRLNAEISGYKRFLSGNTAAFFSVGYYGNDPYNIYFDKHYFFARAGLALGFLVNTNKLNNIE